MSNVLPQELNCVGCSKIPEEEILQCITNHIFCQSCASSVHFCPKCVFQIGEIRSLEVTPVDREFYCPFKSNGCNEVIPQRDIKQHLQICQFGGENVNVCKFLGYQCAKLLNTRNSKEVYEHLHEQHNILPNAGNMVEAELLDVGNLDHYKSVAWSPILVDLENNQLIITAYLKDGAISFTCFSLKEISENFLVEFQLLAKSKEISDIIWLIRPIPISDAEQVVKFPQLGSSLEILQKYYQFDGTFHLSVYVHGNHFSKRKTIGNNITIKLRKIHEIFVNTNSVIMKKHMEVNNNIKEHDVDHFSKSNENINGQSDMGLKEKSREINNNIPSSTDLSMKAQSQFVGFKKMDWFTCFVGVGLGSVLTLTVMAAFKIKSK